MFNFGSYRLKIILGSACNLHCKYCEQNSNICKLPEVISSNLLHYLKWINGFNERTRIQFFGGEPLLYLDKIKQLVQFIEKENLNNFALDIPTNGKLLTEEIIDYCNKHNIVLCLSWEGKNTKLDRGYDVIEDKKDLIFKIKNLAFSSVWTKNSLPFDALSDVQNILNDYRIQTGLNYRINANSLFMCDLSGNNSLNIYDLNILTEQYKKIFRVYKEYMNNHSQEYYENNRLIIEYVQYLISTIRKELQNPTKNAWCDSIVDTLNLDLDGNIYKCPLLLNEPIGNVITDSNRVLLQNYAYSELNIMNRRENMCKDCAAHVICRGGCKEVSNKNIESNCKLWKGLFEIIYNEIISISS